MVQIQEERHHPIDYSACAVRPGVQVVPSGSARSAFAEHTIAVTGDAPVALTVL
ncbi:hypothetical protein [Catellatospora sichuanensis]|uniref:hypothetical protein n=1 Tax=Catellatospora sichuanensis TaxID=1969805 RepID=UPI001642E4F1|nr:hypothetical protein [Catellatospora sichuanensis]